MADEKDDDIELIPVDTPLEDDDKAKEAAETPAEEPEEGEDDGDEDTRLAEDHSEDAGDTEEKRRKRLERRERQKRARENTERELEYLRGRDRQFDQMQQRLAQLEGHQLSSHEQGLQQQYNAKLQEIQTAEAIMAKALEAGNGEDHVLAQRIRDNAINEANQIAQAGQQLVQQRQQAQNPGPDPRMLTHAQEWLQANSWYDPSGGDEDSAITRAIDIAMTREGLDPTSRGYWEELTRRVQARLGSGGNPQETADSGRRRPPPQGNGRSEQGTVSRTREIYVTPERKQAMIEAGYWDDPVKRNQMLKEYQQFDKSNAARS